MSQIPAQVLFKSCLDSCSNIWLNLEHVLGIGPRSYFLVVYSCIYTHAHKFLDHQTSEFTKDYLSDKYDNVFFDFQSDSIFTTFIIDYFDKFNNLQSQLCLLCKRSVLINFTKENEFALKALLHHYLVSIVFQVFILHCLCHYLYLESLKMWVQPF